MGQQHTWTYDAPSGVWKSHTLSKNVYRASIADTQAMQFLKTVDGFGRKRGETVTLQRVSNVTVPTSGVLNENQKIPEDTISFSTKAVTVSEYGRSVPFTNLANELSQLELPDEVNMTLQKQMALTLDIAAMQAFKNAKIKAIPTSGTQITFDTDGTPSSQGTDNLNYAHIEQIRDYLASTLNASPYQGSEYFSMASTKACRGIKQSPEYEVWNRYTNAEAKANGEIGKIEGIRFVEVKHAGALSNSKGLNSVQGEAVFFGMDAAVQAMVLAPHIRVQSSGDFGRSMAAAWYGILAFDLVWDTANPGEANIVHFTSS